MQLILRKRLTGELVRVSGARILCRASRKLAFVAPYPGQWLFHALVPPGSTLVRYNRQPTPSRCRLAVGDLLDLNGLELVVHSVETAPGDRLAETGNPPDCEIELPQQERVRIAADRLVGYDSSAVLRLATTLDGQEATALLAFAAGRWYLHDLNGGSLVHNGKPSGSSLVLADGDRIGIHNQELRFHIGRLPATDTTRRAESAASVSEKAIAAKAQEKDPVYRKARDLCQRLLPVLRDEGRTFPTKGASAVGIRSWLRLLRLPSGPAETLDRLELFLSGSPRNRVWLIELCRFLYQQSFVALSLRVARALCRLHPLDGELMQMLAKLYYRQGCDLGLSAIERLNAFEAAEKCTGVARRLTPDDRVLADLQRVVGAAQKILRGRLAEMAYGEAPLECKVNALEGAR